jgi:ribulose-phosphate 3-epimerase
MSPMLPIKIAPSLLACDFTQLSKEIRVVEKAGSDLLHVDVMDGSFVPNITVGPIVVKAVRGITALPLDVHLMIERPWNYIDAFAKAGAHQIIVHAEACGKRLSETISLIKKHGCRVGVSLRPETPLTSLQSDLERLDVVLLMTVNPGFGGQRFMPEVLPKITSLRKIFEGDIAVDGGVNLVTAKKAIEAGANILVAGTAIFKTPDATKSIHEFRKLAQDAIA